VTAECGNRDLIPVVGAGMRIAVLGTGKIGSTLGGVWQRAGHDVVYGSRSPGKAGPGGSRVVGTGDAIASADVVLIAVPGRAVAELVRAHGGELTGKIVVDAANRVGEPEFHSREAVSAAAPTARYVRAFNTLGWENFAQPPSDADLFFAASANARQVAEDLITAVGLRPVYVGDANAAGIVDGLLPLWFSLVRQRGGNRRLAFRLVGG